MDTSKTIISTNDAAVETAPQIVTAANPWVDLCNSLLGFDPDQVPALVAARELESAYPLLHALMRGSLTDFFLRIAALEALVADARSPLVSGEIAEVLYWFNHAARDSVLRTLRESGWLIYESTVGYRISPAGQFVATVLSFLRTHVSTGDIRPTVEGIDYMVRLGVDPIRQVLLLRSRLEDLRNTMEQARSSHSEVILRAAADRLSDALELSARIREVLDHVSLDMVEALRVAQDIHELLSRLHGVGSDLHSAITEVGRQYLHLVSGLTTSDIVATLMRLPVEELAYAASTSMRPVIRKSVFVVPELLGSAAEAYLARGLTKTTRTEWTDPPEPESMATSIEIPGEIGRLLDDLDRLVDSQKDEALRTFLPRQTAGESLLRTSLLPLLNQSLGGEGVAARLGAMPLKVVLESDGTLIQIASLLSEVSAGTIGMRTEVGNE